MRKMLLFCTALFITYVATAQKQCTLYDILKGSSNSTPISLTVHDQKLYFFATNIPTGRELYVYDTVNRYSLVADIVPSGDGVNAAGPYLKFGSIANTLFFPANDANGGNELFKYDGTNPPVMHTDINPGNGGSFPNLFTNLGGKMYFRAYTNADGQQLYEYDPVSDQVTQLTKFNTPSGPQPIYHIVPFQNKILFVAEDDTTGTELFEYDPATGNTKLIDDIFFGSASSDPLNFVQLDNIMYFSAYTYLRGQELYSYDGTNPPIRLTDLNKDSLDGTSPFPRSVIAYKNKIYFAGMNDTNMFDQLYAYNPLSQTVNSIQVINPFGPARIWGFTIFRDSLFFSADDGMHGSEPWVYDGISAATLLSDVNQGIDPSNPIDFTTYQDAIYFSAYSATNGTELYRYPEDPTLGIRNLHTDALVTVYPNPTTNNATIRIELTNSEQWQVRLMDIQGRLVYQSTQQPLHTGSNEIELPLSDKAAGIYIYSLVDDKGAVQAVGRITKQ